MEFSQHLQLFIAWSPEKVAGEFLTNIGLTYLSEQFIVNKIGGNILASLTEVSYFTDFYTQKMRMA